MVFDIIANSDIIATGRNQVENSDGHCHPLARWDQKCPCTSVSDPL